MPDLIAMRLAVLLAASLVAAPAIAGDAARGNEVFQDRCARCHAISPSELGKRGPYLSGLFQRAPGAVKDFHYRMVFKEAGPVWTEASLDSYLVIHLLPDEVDRSNVITFLKKATADDAAARRAKP